MIDKFFTENSILYKRCHDSCGGVTSCIPFGKNHIGRTQMNGKDIDWYNCQKCGTTFITKSDNQRQEPILDEAPVCREDAVYETPARGEEPHMLKSQLVSNYT